MKITRIEIENIRSIAHLRWELPKGQPAAGWHVILGDNGSGKSTFLRAVAMGLIGLNGPFPLLLGQQLIKIGADEGKVILWFHHTGEAASAFVMGTLWSHTFSWQGPYALKAKNGFSAGFGPFRRFTGADSDYRKIASDFPRLGSHLSLFKENVAMTEVEEWLKNLRLEQLENSSAVAEPSTALQPANTPDFLTQLIAFINQPDFLPHKTQFESVSSQGVFFKDGAGNRITLDDLSDGFRSILSLVFELLRLMQRMQGPDIFLTEGEAVRVKVPGVVLIDEIDAHLHPVWQKQIGPWLTRHFPEIQFFVTTHSPLVCQAAEHGTVFWLPGPGSKEECRMIQGEELNRLVYGNVLEAYSTQLFGLSTTQSAAGQDKTQRLAALNQKALHEDLTPEEQRERDDLRGSLPISDSQAFVDQLLGDL